MTALRDEKHPSNPWGPFAADPWSPLLDPVTGDSWKAAVEAARQMRLAVERTRESVIRLERERQEGRDAPEATMP